MRKMDSENNILSFCHNCRICLTIHQDMMAISSLNESAEFNLLLNYFNIEIITDTRYPSQICIVCVDQLNNILLFKQKCETTFNFLKGALKDIETDKTEISPYEFLNISNEQIKKEDDAKDEETINNNIKKEKCDVKSELDTNENKESEIKINSTDNKHYKCQYCDKIFKKKYRQIQHEAVHLKRPFKCDQCPKSFRNNDILLRHVRIHLGQKPFTCTDCPRTFNTNWSLTRHKRDAHGDQPPQKIVCKECGLAVGNIFAHRKYKHSTYEFQCKYCEKKFAYKSALETHIKNYHENCEESFKILCPLCGKVFRRMSDLNCHNRVKHSDERNYSCKYCDKRFKRCSALTKHTQRHLNIRPFKCTYCERAFAEKQTLINHIRTHTGERPHKCTICSKDFAHNSTLGTHIKLVHGRNLSVQI